MNPEIRFFIRMNLHIIIADINVILIAVIHWYHIDV